MATDAIGFRPQLMAEWRQHAIPSFIMHLEAGFAAGKITDQKTMVCKTQLAVTPAIADEVMDLFINIPSEVPFNELKRRLLARFTPSPEIKFRQLLTSSELGDFVPSALYRRMKSLNSEDFLADDALLTLWKDKLPQTIQLHLTAHSSATLEDKLKMADNLHARAQQKIQVNEISSRPDDMSTKMDQLLRRMTALEAKGEKNSYQPQKRDYQNNRQKPENQSWRRNNYKKPQVQNSGFCYYHNRFGAKSYKCAEPCSFQNHNPRSEN